MFGQSNNAGGAPSGLELALRSMGLATVLDAAKALASSGAVQKIMQFADNLEGFNVRETNERLARIERHLGIEPTFDRLVEGPADGGFVRPAADEPRTGTTDG